MNKHVMREAVLCPEYKPARQRMDKLEAENARLREELALVITLSATEAAALIPAVGEYAADMDKQLAAAQLDAVRYAFLVSRFWDTEGKFSDDIDLLLAQETYPTKQQIDAAIDAAIGRQMKGNGE